MEDLGGGDRSLADKRIFFSTIYQLHKWVKLGQMRVKIAAAIFRWEPQKNRKKTKKAYVMTEMREKVADKQIKVLTFILRFFLAK